MNIVLDEKDREYTKFLWLTDPNDPNSPFREYQFRTVLFGATCSPFLLNTVVQRHLGLTTSPIAADIGRNLYVDNLISGTNQPSSLQYYREATEILQAGGFNLREWISNSDSINAAAAQDKKLGSSSDQMNTLGLKWYPQDDVMSCRTVAIPETEIVTKRHVLSHVCKLYDVYGFLSPVHVKAKIFIQELQKNNHGWDELHTPEYVTRWKSIEQDLYDATSTITWNRRFALDITVQSPVAIHCFVDSSEKAYGCAAYIVSESSAALVMAKNRVAPLKNVTLPRLELMGCLLGANMIKFLRDELQDSLNIEKCVLWTDSQIALAWIHSDKKLPLFVSNRCKQIRAVNLDSVCFCPTADNSADQLTRGIQPATLRTSTLWWHGPHWLVRGDWPLSNIRDSAILLSHDTTDTEDGPPVAAPHPDTHLTNVIDIKRFSTLGKLLRTTALVLRFVHRTRKVGPLQADELDQARMMWIKEIQALSFASEYNFLRKRSAKAGPLVSQLKLFIDENGVIRRGGRLQNSPLPYDCKFPVLLPKEGGITELVIRHAHSRVLHSGTMSTITHLRQNYWIPKIHVFVKSYLRKCTTCNKVMGRP